MAKKRSPGIFLACALTLAQASASLAASDARAGEEIAGGLVALSELYAERARVLHADARCRLLSSPAHDALKASLSQLRGTLLRAGANGSALDAADAILVEEAGTVACHDRDLRETAKDVDAFHTHYLRVRSLSFPAYATSWNADRAERSRYDGWPLVQDFGKPGDDGRIGLTSGDLTTQLSVRVPQSLGNVQSVRLGVLTDKARRQAQERADAAATSKDKPWTLLPQETATIFAFNRWTETLENGETATVFDFPATAITALSQSDPRASFALIFNMVNEVGQVGSRVYTLPVGDFYAAAHFAVSQPAQARAIGASH